MRLQVLANRLTGILGFVEKVGAKDHQRFQASYATLLKAHMAALKKRERKDKKKGVDGDRKDGAGSTKKPKRVWASSCLHPRETIENLCLLINLEKDSFSFEQLEDKEMGFCLTARLKMIFHSHIDCLWSAKICKWLNFFVSLTLDWFVIEISEINIRWYINHFDSLKQ